MMFSRLFGRRPPAGQAPRPTVELGQLQSADPTSPEMRIIAGVATDPGCVREINEDSVQVLRPETAADVARIGVLAIVCDGMGGHEAGEVASRLALEAFVRQVRSDESDPAKLLVRAMEAANRAVVDAAARETRLSGMGTTCTALLLRDGLAHCAHVGDSRCYMIRDGEIFLMTEDHSAVMELVRRGAISLDEARHHPDKNVISRALGSQRNVAVTSWPQPMVVRPGDRFLVCSDGLYDLVSDEDIRVVAGGYDPQDACDRLVQMAREHGGFDNISVAVLSMGESRRESSPPESTTPRETRIVESPK
ncbi:MAG: Stp1/IreP family PP2C-type Ser/Thr phosphatase [Gemmatimonadota bacterium]